jgi:hypothetical protein
MSCEMLEPSTSDFFRSRSRHTPGGDHWVLTFPDGQEVRECIVDIDDAHRRLANAVIGGDSLGLTFHHASFQVVPNGPGRCGLVWLADILPRNRAEEVRVRMIAGAEEMRRTLQRS